MSRVSLRSLLFALLGLACHCAVADQKNKKSGSGSQSPSTKQSSTAGSKGIPSKTHGVGSGTVATQSSSTGSSQKGGYCVVSTMNDLSSCKKTTMIMIQNLAVPAGVTLDLTDVLPGTTITFKGQTTFGYKEWYGPLIAITGDNLLIDGDGTLNGGGARWWDQGGLNFGKKK